MPDFLDPDFSAFANATFSQNVPDPAQPFPPFIGESFPNFSWHTPPDSLPVQAVERSAFSSFAASPRFPSFHPQITMRPVYDVARNWNPCYEGVTEAKLWHTGDVLSSTVVPAIPPVRFVSCVLKRSSNFEQHSRPQLSQPTGSRYPKGVIIKDRSNWTSSDWNPSASAPRIIWESTSGMPFARTSPLSMVLMTQYFKVSREASRVGYWWASCAYIWPATELTSPKFPGYPDNGSSCQVRPLCTRTMMLCIDNEMADSYAGLDQGP